MTWQLVGFTKGDRSAGSSGNSRSSGVEFVLDDDLFEDEEATQWLGPAVRLSKALWPLPVERISDAEELVGTALDVASTDFYLLRQPRWFVTAHRDGARPGPESEAGREREPEPMAIEYHLPEEFGFAQAAQWIGGWFPGMAYARTPLPVERGTEIETRFGTAPTPGVYRHFLGSSARPDQ